LRDLTSKIFFDKLVGSPTIYLSVTSSRLNSVDNQRRPKYFRAQIFHTILDQLLPVTQNHQATAFSHIDRTSIKDLALEQLKRYILAADILPGQRLPSERELAERLGVGRNSVREALKVLEAVGLVESRIGEGTFITAQTGTSIGRAIGFGLAAWGGAIMEILGARQIIEVEAARVAAENADEPDLRNLANELQRMEAAIGRSREYLAADMNFHRLVGKATHNAIVAQIIAGLIDLLEEVLREVHTDQLPTSSEGPGTHRAVYEAITCRNPAAAGEMMRQHLQFSTELWRTMVSLGATSQSNGDR
jgi:GntR family transcriptional repressor for pyruvate dehydrogenase complex